VRINTLSANPKYVKIKKDDYDGAIDIIGKIAFADGKIHLRDVNETGMDLYQAEKGDLVTSKINIHQGAVAIAERKLVSSTHYQVYEIDRTQILPEYLVIALRSKQFQDRINEVKNNGIKNEQGADFLKSQEIPLPSLEEQGKIVCQIENQKAIIEGAEKILSNYVIPSELFNAKEGRKAYLMSDVCKFTGGSQPPKEDFIHEGKEGYVRLVQIRDFKSDDFITYVPQNSVTKFFKEDDIMIARYGPPLFQILKGMSGAYNVALMKAIPNEELVLKDYWFYYLQNPVIQEFVIDSSQRTAGQSGVNLDHLYTFQVFLPNKEVQKNIVRDLDTQMKVLEGIKKMRANSEQTIIEILTDMWGMG